MLMLIISLKGDEDCLYVNVYTPNTNPKKKMNVLVHIHMGAFMFNWGGFYRPDILLDRDIVYVNFNYRLGPLGKIVLLFTLSIIKLLNYCRFP